MVKTISKSTSIKVLIGLLLVSITLFTGYLMKASAESPVDPPTASLVQNSLSKITNNEFGQPSVTGETDNINGNKLIVAADNQNIYKVKANDDKIITLQSKVSANLEKNQSQDSSTQLSDTTKNYLKKYHPSSIGKNYILSDSDSKDSTNAKYNQFTYDEVAPNGQKTGERVSVIVNNAGSLVGMAVHEGNADVAQNTQPKLSKEDAVKIVSDDVKNKNVFLKDATFPQDQSELTVWNDKLDTAENVV